MTKKPKIAVAVICRLKSTRLPKKALLKIYGVESIVRCLFNATNIPEVDEVVLATSYLKEDDPLEGFTLGGKIKVYRGDPDNVATRMFNVAAMTGADIILRITGDCPVVAPELVSYLIKLHLNAGADLTIPDEHYPVGTGADVYSVAALQKLLDQPDKLTHTEYLSLYFINNPHLFNVNKVALPKEFRHPEWRLTLDEKDDLLLFEKIFSSLNIGEEPLYYTVLAEFLKNNPKIASINSHVKHKWKNKEINDATSLAPPPPL